MWPGLQKIGLGKILETALTPFSNKYMPGFVQNRRNYAKIPISIAMTPFQSCTNGESQKRFLLS